MELTLMKGGTSHRIRSYDTGWWGREVGTMGGGDDGKWWGREVVTKGSGDEGEWWGREVGTKGGGDGSGEEGKWLRREVVMKGSGEEGRRGRWEVVRKGSGDEGKWWGREVVTKGGGDDGKWWRSSWSCVHRSCVRSSMRFLNLWLHIALEWLHECCMGFVWGGSRSTKPCVFRVKWLQAAMKGTSCVRRVRLRSFGSFYVSCNTGCSCVRSAMRFLKLWLQIALEWLHECCMGFVLGRKPEHETLCFLCKVAAAGDERYLVFVWRVRLRSFGSFYCVLQHWLFLCA